MTCFCLLQRKKEKRLEKQNAVKALLCVGFILLILAGGSEGIISDSPSCGFLSPLFMSSLEDGEGNCEDHNEDDFAESDGERNGAAESARTPTPNETAEDEERSEAEQEEEKFVETAEEEEEEEIKVCGDLWSSGNYVLLKQPFICELTHSNLQQNPDDAAAAEEEEYEKRSRELAG